jgi:hypothetical protein
LSNSKFPIFVSSKFIKAPYQQIEFPVLYNRSTRKSQATQRKSGVQQMPEKNDMSKRSNKAC